MRPILSYTGAPPYEISNFIANILKSSGKLKEQHTHSSKSFSAFMCQQKIEPEEIMVSFDVTSLYTTIPIDQALLIIKDLPENDDKLADRTLLSPRQILDLQHLIFYYAPHTSNSVEISTNKQTEQQWEVQLQPLFQRSICNH